MPELFIDLLSTLRQTDENLRVATALLFFEIGRAGQKGVTVRELMDATGMPQASVSRHMHRLSAKPSDSQHVGEALGLVEMRPDPEEGRRNRIVLSPAGKELMARVGTLVVPVMA
jgi:DNA-binding MarR family transcriptional regulator